MMRVGVDIQALQSEESRDRGIGRYTLALLEALLRRGTPVEYQFFANKALAEPSLNVDDLSCRWVECPLPGNSLENGLLMKTALHCSEVESLFLPNPVVGSDSTMPNFAGFPRNVCAICYDLIPLLFADHYLREPSARAAYLNRLDNIRQADLVFAISEATRRDAVEHLKLSPDRVINISSGVSPFFHPLTEEERITWRAHVAQKFGIDRSFILYTGGEDWRKNLSGLVTAFSRLPQSLRHEYHLVIACRLSDGIVQELKEIATQCGVVDNLTLTNFVTDNELRALYGLCSLFVFPSFYEGFGLPVLEAMACGAPAIAGNNSSLTEIIGDPTLLFDAGSADAIAGAIERVLGDERLRQKTRTEALRRADMFSWDSVAERVETGFLSHYQERPRTNRNTLNFCRLERDSLKPRLAFFSPFRPVKSGISDYSENLLPALENHFDIDLYFSKSYRPDADLSGGMFATRTFRETRFERNVTKRNYEIVLYHIGNSENHNLAYATLMRYGGITVLHDYHLAGLVYEMHQHEKALGITLPEELAHNYGTSRSKEILKGLETGQLNMTKLSQEGIHINRRIFTRSYGVIVHNRWAYDAAVRDFQNDCEHIVCIPLLTPGVNPDPSAGAVIRRRLGIPEDSFLVATFGIVGQTKRPHAILKAFKVYITKNPKAHLIFVGDVSREQADAINAEIHGHGLEEHVHITGFVGMSEFCLFIQAVDICLNLRYPYHGETSAALLQLLSYGKPTIVTDIGSFSEFPDDVVFKIPVPSDDDEAETVYEALIALTQNAHLRAALSREAAQYALREHSPERCALLYSQFIEKVLSAPTTQRKMLADYVGREAGTVRTKAPFKLFKAFAETIDLCSTPESFSSTSMSGTTAISLE